MNQKNVIEKDCMISSIREIIKSILINTRRRKDCLTNSLPTGFVELDRMLLGLNNGNLIVIAGHPGIGTTAFALRTAENLSIDKDVQVLYFSMGIGKENLMERMLFGRAKLNLGRAHQVKLENQDWDTLHKIAEEISAKPIYIDDTPRLTPDELWEKAIKLKNEKDIKCVIIDSLQLMRLKEKTELHEEDFAEISRILKLLALKLNIPVLLLVQLGFDLIQKDENRVMPRLADLGEAIIVERYADVLMLINRESYYSYCEPDNNFTEIIITRNNNGSTGTAGLHFHRELARFENIIEAKR